jgi:cytochrome b561
MAKPSSLYDRQDSFGWISIALHWTSSIAIIALWLLGQSIMAQAPEAVDARRALHVTLGLIAWLPIAARIVWRFKTTHPQVTGQSALTHRAAQLTHYLMLLALSVMLVSGPIMAWALPERVELASYALLFHGNAAILLVGLVVLHILAALKHLMFHDDETIARIFLPKAAQNDSSD